jgi:hypothetical protein
MIHAIWQNRPFSSSYRRPIGHAPAKCKIRRQSSDHHGSYASKNFSLHLAFRPSPALRRHHQRVPFASAAPCGSSGRRPIASTRLRSTRKLLAR